MIGVEGDTAPSRARLAGCGIRLPGIVPTLAVLGKFGVEVVAVFGGDTLALESLLIGTAN